MGATFTLISGMISQILTFLVPIITGLSMAVVVIACAVLGGFVLGGTAGILAEKLGGGDCYKKGTVAAAICDTFTMIGVVGTILLVVFC